MAALHHSDPPLIHRDLKVENILIDDHNHGADDVVNNENHHHNQQQQQQRHRHRRRRHVLCDFGSCVSERFYAFDVGNGASGQQPRNLLDVEEEIKKYTTVSA